MGKGTSAGKSALNVLQITDCHLKNDPQGKLLGVNTRESLAAVLQQVRQDVQQSGETPDLILATGDLAQDGSEGAYRYFQQQLAEFDCPSYWLPGNHDNRQAMAAVANGSGELQPIIDAGSWRIIMLDSLVSGKVHGLLEDSQLQVLESGLKAAGDRYVLVCCHHHPVQVNSHWLDKIGLHNHQQFFDVLESYSAAKAVLWGHVHQEYDGLLGSIRLLASPSTCIQFKQQSQGFAVEALQPGYRWLKLLADGGIDSSVRRTNDYDFQLDLQSNGY